MADGSLLFVFSFESDVEKTTLSKTENRKLIATSPHHPHATGHLNCYKRSSISDFSTSLFLFHTITVPTPIQKNQ
jgi:hypothetical protein